MQVGHLQARVRLRSHTIEMRYVGRREARVQLWRENRTDDVSSEAHGDVARRYRGECQGHGCTRVPSRRRGG